VILRPEEPFAGQFEPWPLTRLADAVASANADSPAPAVVAVDGRGASGKSTLARALASALPAAVVVHTDDVAWHHSFFDWADLMLSGVLAPALAGRAVAYRPPAWDEHGRPGAIEIPAGSRVVLVEGTGAARRELEHLLSFRIWVQSDFFLAERRGIERDIAQGVNGDAREAFAFWHEWQAQEVPFFATDRPWERADLVTCGTPLTDVGPEGVLVARPAG
jgi:hypothetical protein